jgi:hypothetical protein
MTHLLLSAILAVGVAITPGFALAQGATLTGDGEKPGQRIEIRDLKRDEGGTLTLRFQLINEGDHEINSCSFRDSSDSCGTVGGVHLIDAGNKKKYLVVRDAQKKCVCSNGIDSVRRGDRSNAWAKFPAPPDTVQKITVVVPGFEPIEGVPITSR